MDEVLRYISRLERFESFLLNMDQLEIAEAKSLTINLRNIRAYTNPGKSVQTRPRFSRCGIVDNCEGDIIVGTTLYELKNVERDFRIADLRQLLTYCALNHASRQYEIESIGLINARSGLTHRIDLNKFAFSTAGVSSSELFDDIIIYITADFPSR